MKQRWKTNKSILFLELIIILAIFNFVSFSNMLVNGDFETGDLTGWNWTPTSYPDPAMGTSVVTFEAKSGNPSLCFRVNPGTDMQHVSRSEEGGYLWQTLNLQAGLEYSVTIGAAAISAIYANNADGGRMRLYIGSDLLWDWSVGDIDYLETLRNSYSGTYIPAATAQYEFQILFTRTYMNSPTTILHYIDDVSVVPEPATMLLLGLGGLLLRQNKR